LVTEYIVMLGEGGLALSKLIIKGGTPLEGKVKVSGAKNAALAIMAAAVMAEGETVLENVPLINDVIVFANILQSLGIHVLWMEQDCLSIWAPEDMGHVAAYDQVKRLRASNLLLGALLARKGKAQISMPGGCRIGSRPMDLHIKGLVQMGCEVSMEHGFIKSKALKMKGAHIYLDFPSVGATENIMMAASKAQGLTVIENAAKEPEIVDLANFLNAMGARVRGAGTDVIKITGAKTLKGVKYSIIPDRIEAGTFMAAAVITGGNVVVENVIPTHLKPVLAKLQETGAYIRENDMSIKVAGPEQIKASDVKTLPYPGFPTDMQSQMMALLTLADGTSIIVENVFENRFQVANELKRMGARIKVEGRSAVVLGIPELSGTVVKAPDLRSGAALILAALAARGETQIHQVEFIDRGYLNIEDKLRLLGADIVRVS